MTQSPPSPFAAADPTLRTRPGAPHLRRPTREEIQTFPSQAQELLEKTRTAQHSLLQSGTYDLRWMEGRHLLLAGATGAGLGVRLAVAALSKVGDRGSVTVLARDLTRSLGYETVNALKLYAGGAGFGNRFQWLNCGMATEGERL